MDTRDRAAIAFGPFRFDTAGRTLFRDGVPVALTPKAADLLAVLLLSRGTVLSREELDRTVWGDTFVDVNNLHQQIAALRKILGNEWIETVPRRGYRFVAEPEAASPLPIETRPRRGRWLALGSAAALIVLASCILLYARHPRPDPIRADSIAVLPLKSLGSDGDHLSLGVTDALITKLSSVSNVDVRPLSAVYEFRGMQSDPVTAGRRLHVDAVLDGTTQRDGDRVLLRVRLVDVASGRQLWSASYSESLSDIFAVQDRVSAAVVEAVSGRLTPSATQKQYARIDPYVVDEYMRGRYHFAQRQQERYEQAAACYRRALTRDPNFAPAWAGLGDVLNFRGQVAEAKDAARRALSLDPTLADAHAVLGNAYFFHDRDLPAADREFQLAIQLNPSCTNARHWYAYLLAARGRMPDALREIEAARRIDPLSLPIQTAVGSLMYYSGKFDESIAAFQQAVELDPNYVQAHIELALALAAKGDAEAAEAIFARPAVAPYYGAGIAAYLAARRGDARRAESLLEKVLAKRPQDSFWIAATYVALRQNEAALAWLTRAMQAHSADAVLAGIDPKFAPLRASPRFREVVAAATGP